MHNNIGDYMRLWHYKLIKYLPNKMLVSQWRECIAIKRQWEKGTLKHRLVSYVKKYEKGYFLNYVEIVVSELNNRNIKYNNKYLNEIKNFCGNKISSIYMEHNNRYLKQCYFNLEEKYDRGIIDNEEFIKIKQIVNKSIKL